MPRHLPLRSVDRQAQAQLVLKFARWLRVVPVEPDLPLNLQASELTGAHAPAVRLQRA